MNRVFVRQVAVLGAGVMGAQIAAHFVNCNIPVILFDLAATDGPRNGIVAKAVDRLKALKPAALGVPEAASLIRQANYDDHLDLLMGCELIVEAIAENIDAKRALYERIAPSIADHAIVTSNTSGVSIAALSEVLPDAIKPRFCGVHFFNPPRYMTLVELIGTPATQPDVLDRLEALITTALGKNVVRARDTPNFIANRVGIASLLATMKEAETYGLSYDLVDDLTGRKLGRPHSGTFRTADVVGLDTMSQVIRTQHANLAADPFHGSFALPPVFTTLIGRGAFGQKSGAGFYKKVGKDILRFDPACGDYVASGAKMDEIVSRILKKPTAERLRLLRESKNPQARFLWAILRDSFHYAAVHLADIADNARDVDLAMRWGFGASQGPFEMWQDAGWLRLAHWIREDIDAGLALCRAPLPAWVFEGPVAAQEGVHRADGSWAARHAGWVAPSTLPVYRRQAFRESVSGSNTPAPRAAGIEEFSNDEVRVWSLDGEVLVATITAKLHLISPLVTEGLLKAIEIAESRYTGLVIWSPDDVFSAGANLEVLMPVFMKSGSPGILKEVEKLQQAMLRIRYANVPVVAAVHGMALGGGCELALHAARRVATMESYMGLVEVGIGLIPSGGGLACIARRAAERAAAPSSGSAPGPELFKFLVEGFTSAAMAKVSTSAVEARQLGYLMWSDVIVLHKGELLHVASQQVRAMYESGYRPPVRASFPVAGRDAIATIKAQLVSMREGRFISAHDFHISSLLADVVCGGDVDAGSLVDEQYLMALERQHFCALLDQEKTQERIVGMLETGKPVRN